MEEYVAARTRDRAILELDGYRFEAISPHIDRGAVRVSLAVYNGALVYRDMVNLTSERARAKAITKLADKGVVIVEDVLIALDETCRTKPPEAPEKHTHATPSDVSDKVPDLPALQRIFDHYLLIKDRDYLAVLTGAVTAHSLGFEPVWPLIVGPPGGTKTEPIRSLYGYPGVYPLSSLTPRTFASGLDIPGADDPSLLARLNDEIIVVKDLTTLLTIDRDGRQEVFAQLREIYDGDFARTWGTGKRLEWHGRLGFIGGVTDIIDQHHAALSVLGDRFILFRLIGPNRAALARKAMGNAGKEDQMRADLRAAMHGFLANRPTTKPAVSPETVNSLVELADFVTRARSGVFRDGFKRELEYVPEPEAPTRFAKQMLALASGLAVVLGHDEVGEDELRIVHRVGLDCLPTLRRRVLTTLADGELVAGDGSIDTSRVAGAARFSTAAVRRALEELYGLGVVEREKGGPGKADRWMLPDEMKGIFAYLTAYADSADLDSQTETPATENPSNDADVADVADVAGFQEKEGKPRETRPIQEQRDIDGELAVLNEKLAAISSWQHCDTWHGAQETHCTKCGASRPAEQEMEAF